MRHLRNTNNDSVEMFDLLGRSPQEERNTHVRRVFEIWSAGDRRRKYRDGGERWSQRPNRRHTDSGFGVVEMDLKKGAMDVLRHSLSGELEELTMD